MGRWEDFILEQHHLLLGWLLRAHLRLASTLKQSKHCRFELQHSGHDLLLNAAFSEKPLFALASDSCRHLLYPEDMNAPFISVILWWFLKGGAQSGLPQLQAIIPSAAFAGSIISFILCPSELVKVLVEWLKFCPSTCLLFLNMLAVMVCFSARCRSRLLILLFQRPPDIMVLLIALLKQLKAKGWVEKWFCFMYLVLFSFFLLFQLMNFLSDNRPFPWGLCNIIKRIDSKCSLFRYLWACTLLYAFGSQS